MPVIAPSLAAATVLLLALDDGPFSFWGDKATEETAVQQAASFDQLVGPYSNFGFFHPGPALFYVLAPVYAATGRNAIGLSLGALLINATAGVGVVVVVRHVLGSSGGVLAGLLVALHFWAWSEGVFEHWNPATAVLPVLLAVVLWAASSERGWPWLVAGCVPAFFAVQTHLGTAPVLGATFVIAALGCVAWTRARDQLSTATKAAVIVAGALSVVLWLPPAWQQVTADRGARNLSAVLSVTKDGPPRPAGHEVGWSFAAAWRAVAHEATRTPFRWGPAPSPTLPLDLGAQPASVPRQGLWVGTLVLAGVVVVVGGRRRRPVIAMAGAMTLVGTGAAVIAAMRVPGPLANYQLWSSATMLYPTWIASGTLASERLRQGVPVLTGGVVAAAAAVVVVVAFGADLAHPVPEPFGQQALAISDLLRRSSVGGHATVVAWGPGLRPVAPGVIASLRREGADVSVLAGQRHEFGSAMVADGEERALVLLTGPRGGVHRIQPTLPRRWRCPPASLGRVADVDVWSIARRC